MLAPAAEKPSLLVVGGASLDLLHFSGQQARCAGGAGLYTALAAQRSGVRVVMYGPRPQPMPEELRAVDERVEWVGPTVSPEELPHFEIANYGGGTEMLRLSWGAEARLRPEEAPAAGRTADWIYCVPLADPSLQLAFVRHFKAQGRRVACGTYGRLASDHHDVTRTAIAEADAFFCNEAEARALLADAERPCVRPGQLLFVTRGARGARVVQGSYVTELPGLPAWELDPTGAGDTFCGTTLARLVLGDHPVEAARHGVAHAARMIGEVGPRALLAPAPAEAPPEDPRVTLDPERIARVAALLAASPELRRFDFASELFPPVGDPWALDFFFAATLQQFGFWRLSEERYGGPMIARLGGRSLKGSDYLWAAYRRWMAADPAGLTPAAQAALDAGQFEARLRADDGGVPLPEPERYLDAARAYGADMAALGVTAQGLLAEANASSAPVRALLQRLDHVGGYKEDPLRKKSALLALILAERPEGFLRRGDLPPIVDYHVQRSCLRLGLVLVQDAALGEALVARRRLQAPDEDAVRRAALRATRALQEASGRSMAACDHFLFAMRHRCPELTEPQCARCPADPACAHRKELFQPILPTTFY